MDDLVETPRIPQSVSKSNINLAAKEALLSSSPGFGTPAYPIASRPAKQLAQPFANSKKTNQAQTILPIILPPQTLRPVAFRTLTKKHNLTLTSAGLSSLSQFIGKFCGSGWREDGLAERLLDEISKQWKQQNGNIIVDDASDKKLQNLLKSLEPCMSGGRLDLGRISHGTSNNGVALHRMEEGLRSGISREDSQNSVGLSGLDITDNFDSQNARNAKQDVRAYLKVISAFEQPRLSYSTSKKMLEVSSGEPSIIPTVQHKISMFRNRYHLVHQRLLRNEAFQAPSLQATFAPPRLLQSSSTATAQQIYKITPISNLLGRTHTSHLLLGLLVKTAAGDLAVTDLTSSVVLDMSGARPVPDDGVWFCPGMLVLVEGLYDEDGLYNASLGSASGVGGQIRGHFVVDTMAGPPAERRESTLGLHTNKQVANLNIAGTGFGWVDFLGTGSEKAVGPRMRQIQQRLLKEEDIEEDRPKRTKMILIGECNLDSPRTTEAIRAILSSYVSTQHAADHPLSIVLMGNFISAASMAGSSKGGGSIEYKEYFDHLASMLSEFPTLLSGTTFIFVPGDNDPWASSFSAGAATLIPRQGVPELFTSRIRRAINVANGEAGSTEDDIPGQAIWTSNPARISLFGPVEEIVLFRDDITGRLRRNAVMFSKPPSDETENTPNSNLAPPRNSSEILGEHDTAVHVATAHLPRTGDKLTPAASTVTARKLVKTILDQSHLSPFPISTRPVIWDHASSLDIYPLPSALVLADAEAPSFAITYEGCHVMNPGRVLDDLGMRKGIAKWVEYDVKTRRGVTRDVRF